MATAEMATQNSIPSAFCQFCSTAYIPICCETAVSWRVQLCGASQFSGANNQGTEVIGEAGEKDPAAAEQPSCTIFLGREFFCFARHAAGAIWELLRWQIAKIAAFDLVFQGDKRKVLS